LGELLGGCWKDSGVDMTQEPSIEDHCKEAQEESGHGDESRPAIDQQSQINLPAEISH